MSDAHTIYRIIRKTLLKSMDGTSQRQANHLNVLTGFICGVVQSKSVKLPDVAEDIPSESKIESVVIQLRRWLKNEAVDVSVYYLPFIENLIACLAKQSLVLIIDGSTTARGCVTLMVSMLYQGRALPLLWVTRKGKKGHFPQSMHIELITAVKQIIPAGTDVICLGDGEFDGTQWLQTIEGFGWHYVCRTAKNAVFYGEGECFSAQEISPKHGKMTLIAGVEFTKKRDITVSVVAYWGRKYKEPLYLVSNFLVGEEAIYWYRKRFRIETLFSDLKGRGFNLQKSGLSLPDRVSRLIMVAALAYIWIVYLGALALEKGWDKIIHRTERCDLSLFSLGKRLLKHLLKQGKAIPSFCLTLSGKALT